MSYLFGSIRISVDWNLVRGGGNSPNKSSLICRSASLIWPEILLNYPSYLYSSLNNYLIDLMVMGLEYCCRICWIGNPELRCSWKEPIFWDDVFTFNLSIGIVSNLIEFYLIIFHIMLSYKKFMRLVNPVIWTEVLSKQAPFLAMTLSPSMNELLHFLNALNYILQYSVSCSCRKTVN